MKKFVSLKTKALTAMSLAIILTIVGVIAVVNVFSSLSYSQKIKSPFNMSYKAPINWESIVYPQTYVGDTLNSTLENLISSNSSSLVATGKKYTTDAKGTTKECLEYTYNDQRYARLVGAVPNGSSVKWLNSTINTYSLTTTTITEGANYWFKVEPIEFDTFTGISEIDGAVKIAKMILGSQAFDSSSNDWSTSSLKTYLNSTFLTETGLDKVAKDRTYYSTRYSSSTTIADNGTQVTSKLWLPSYSEIQEMYSTDAERHKVATDFARATWTYVTTATDESYQKDINGTSENCSYFWLRTANSYDYTSVWGIFLGGDIYGLDCYNTTYGFSPAFVVDE